MSILLYALLALLLMVEPVAAAPVITGIGAILKAGTIGAALLKTAIGIGLNMLATALLKPDDPGIRTESTTAGGDIPQSTIIGRYATEGNFVCPVLTHGKKNNWMTYVIDVGDLPIEGIESAIVDDVPMVFDGVENPAYGYPPSEGDYTRALYARFFDGTQTAAPANMLTHYGTEPDYPWAADMIGEGIPYAVLNLSQAAKVWSGGRPRARFIAKGAKLYDPRKDSTAGGTGAHRWGDVNTYEWTENALVQAYNVARHIDLQNGYTWGIKMPTLRYAEWAAAMDECDVLNENGDPQYRAGYEIYFGNDQPLDVFDRLIQAGNCEVVEVAGDLRVRSGGPGLPVKFITDDDILIDHAQELDPWPGIEQTVNVVHTSYISEEAGWETTETANVYKDTAAIAEDGEELPAHLQFSVVTDEYQAQQLGIAWAKDARRFRRHVIPLPPEAIMLSPLDVIEWTSERNGYTDKTFGIEEMSIDPKTLAVTLSVRETEATDFDPPGALTPSDATADNSGALPEYAGVPTFSFNFNSTVWLDEVGGHHVDWDITVSANIDIERFEMQRRVAVDPVEGDTWVALGSDEDGKFEVRDVHFVTVRVRSLSVLGDWSDWSADYSAQVIQQAVTPQDFAFDNLSVEGSLRMGDGIRAYFGSDDDMAMFHDGFNGAIEVSTGQLLLRGPSILGQIDNGAGGWTTIFGAGAGGSFNAYHNGDLKFNTTSVGATLSGRLTLFANDPAQDNTRIHFNRIEGPYYFWMGAPNWDPDSFYFYMSNHSGGSEAAAKYANRTWTFYSEGVKAVTMAAAKVTVHNAFKFPDYTVLTKPNPGASGVAAGIYISDTSAGPQLAVSNGSAWVGQVDGNIII